MPDELTSLLFLQNPKKLSSRVSSIGLNELIAQTLSEEYPSRDLINEFDSAISSLQNISDDDYKILLSSISQESTIKIHKLIHVSVTEPERFNKDVYTIIENERNNKLNEDNKHKLEIQKNKKLQDDNENLSKQLSDISNQIAGIQEQYRLDKQQEEYLYKRNKRNNRIYISIIVVLGTIIILQSFPNLVTWLKKVIQIICSLGGVWGFFNLILNFCSKSKSISKMK